MLNSTMLEWWQEYENNDTRSQVCSRNGQIDMALQAMLYQQANTEEFILKCVEESAKRVAPGFGMNWASINQVYKRAYTHERP